MADLADFEWLTSTAAERWLRECANRDLPVHRQLDALRKDLTAERARLIVQQSELRQRAATKFGPLAGRLFFTDVALQQATDIWTAHYKANRLGSDKSLVDYCCGIGGDLIAFASHTTATGWDRAAEVAQLAGANLSAVHADRSRVCVGLVEDQSPATDTVWHLDPDRRIDGRRSTQLQWHSPGPEVVDRWLQINPWGVLKLAPATDVPAAWAESAELEWISCDRQCRQQVAWFGELAQAPRQRRATVITKSPDNYEAAPVSSFVGSPNELTPIVDQVGEYLYDTDPALRAASLTGALANALGLVALHSGPTYFTSQQPLDSPLLTRFRVTEVMPHRVKVLGQHLRKLGIGPLEIKTRGVDTDPQQLRRQLKLRGDAEATLLLTRIGDRQIAVLAQRCEG